MRVLALMVAAMLGQTSQVPSGIVQGTVYRTGTTDPIENAQVHLGLPALRMNTRTNKDGRFAFAGLVPGEYSIRVERDGYFPPPMPGSAPYSGLVLDVSANPRANTITLFLTPAGAITGRVLDPLGRPSTAATVTAARLNYLEGRPTLTPVKTTTSNDRGEYRLFWLEPGEYFVVAEKSLPTGPTRAFFPGTDDRHSALQVDVAEGVESAKTDFVLRNIPAAVSVSGVVTSLIPGFASPPPQAPQFYLAAVDSEGIDEIPIAVPNALTSSQDRASGKFELRNVQPGTYELYAVVQDRSSKPAGLYIAHTTVDVGLENVTDVALTLVPGIDLRGRVASTPAVALPAGAIKIELRPNVGLPNPAIAESFSVAVSADGTFTIPNVPEFRYTVSIGPLAPNTYVSDILQGRNSVLDRGTIVVARGLPDMLEVTLQAPAGTVRGTVAATAQQLASGVTITLAPDSPRRDNRSLYRRVVPNADGSFRIGDVTPGAYRLFAWARIPKGAEQSGPFMESHWDSGMDILVDAGRSTSPGPLRLIQK